MFSFLVSPLLSSIMGTKFEHNIGVAERYAKYVDLSGLLWAAQTARRRIEVVRILAGPGFVRF